jgi:hypothetical protein
MAKDTITFELGGRVDIRHLEEGIVAFRRLVAALTGDTGVAWVVDDLQPGSAITTIRGEAENPAEVERIVRRFGEVGRALERHEALPHISQMAQATDAIRRVARSVEYVRFETPDDDYTIYGNGKIPRRATMTTTIGAVSGRVQTLSNRGGLRFNLYDTVHDKAVACYLAPGQEDIMRETWGQRARISGRVSREVETGRPVAIRQILKVEIIQVAPPDTYLQARGAVPWQEGSLLPEDTIRRMRDG